MYGVEIMKCVHGRALSVRDLHAGKTNERADATAVVLIPRCAIPPSAYIAKRYCMYNSKLCDVDCLRSVIR